MTVSNQTVYKTRNQANVDFMSGLLTPGLEDTIPIPCL